MFDIGFWEIALIGVIALLVVGPERLPGMARNVGFWVGRIRRYVNQVKGDIEREIHAEGLKDALKKPAGVEDLYDMVKETKSTLDEAADTLRSTKREADGGMDTATERPADDVSDVPDKPAWARSLSGGPNAEPSPGAMSAPPAAQAADAAPVSPAPDAAAVDAPAAGASAAPDADTGTARTPPTTSGASTSGGSEPSEPSSADERRTS